MVYGHRLVIVPLTINKKSLQIAYIVARPSKHAGSDSHPVDVRIVWEALAKCGPNDSRTPACFRTGSVWPKPDTVSQNEIGPETGFAQYYPGCL